MKHLDVDTLWKTAILTIFKTSKDPSDVIFELDWSEYSIGFMKSGTLTAEDQFETAKSYFSKSEKEAIGKYLNEGIYTKERLEDVGRLIWKLFPVPIQVCLGKFDLYALEVSSISPISLIIRADILDIPWDLCVTECPTELQNKVSEEINKSKRKKWFESNWFLKYRTSVELFGNYKKNESENRKREKKNLLLIAKTCKELNNNECKDFENEYKKLIELKEKLENKERINIHIHEAPNSVHELKELERDFKEWDYDLVVYLGPYKHKKYKNDTEGMKVDNPITKDPEFIKPEIINMKNQPLVFLDACCTAKSRFTSKKNDSDFSIDLMKYFISSGASAYIGTIQEIETITATVFAERLLNSIFNRASSLSKAMYDARVETYNYFSGSNMPDKEMFLAECCSFLLCGHSDEILLDSFRYRRTELSFIYPKVAEHYFSGFNEYIYPTSIPGIEVCQEPNVEKVIERIDDIAKPFVADVSIMQAAKLISKYKGKKEEELVIIGGLFRLKKEVNDCSFYYSKNKPLKDYKIFYQEDHLSTVTIMALTYLLDKGFYENFKKKSSQKEMLYEQIYRNKINSIEEGNYDIDPFVLAAEYKSCFDKYIRERGIEDKFISVFLYKYFLNMIEEKYDNYTFFENLPAEVLITRREDVFRDNKLYIDIFSQWGKWKEEKENTFLESQEIIFSFDEKDINTIINFTKFVYCELDGFFSEKEKPLERNDFYVVHSWEENEKELKESREKYLKVIYRYKRYHGYKLNKKLEDTRKQYKEAEKANKIGPGLEKKLNKDEENIVKLENFYSKYSDKINFTKTNKQIEKIRYELKEELKNSKFNLQSNT